MAETAEQLSPHYPKWMYKAGSRDELVQNAAQEAAMRDKGYGHEIPAEETPAPVTFGTKPPEDKGTPGTVPVAVMDAALDNLKKRFDGAWDEKCDELKRVQAELADLKVAHAKLIQETAPAPKLVDAAPPAADAGVPLKPPVAAKAKG